ncbi:MAG TPA: hypothetical protein VHP32_03050 [Ignavibacteria bacterium]|nr:hypothetical protein [Ignavibacteria bacterium]
MNIRLFINRNVTLNRCPNCKEIGTLKRKRHLSFMMQVQKIFFLRQFNCQNCGWSGTLFTKRLSKNYLVVIIFYIALIGVTYFLMTFILKNLFK